MVSGCRYAFIAFMVWGPGFRYFIAFIAIAFIAFMGWGNDSVAITQRLEPNGYGIMNDSGGF